MTNHIFGLYCAFVFGAVMVNPDFTRSHRVYCLALLALVLMVWLSV